MIAFRRTLALVCALAAAAPAAARPVGAGWHAGPAHGVTVHSGHRGGAMRSDRGFGPAYGTGADGDPGVLPVGYWEANYGRQDDAAIFARRYGCARPIWNAKYNRYTAPCH